jgi:hypothetical protein
MCNFTVSRQRNLELRSEWWRTMPSSKLELEILQLAFVKHATICSQSAILLHSATLSRFGLLPPCKGNYSESILGVIFIVTSCTETLTVHSLSILHPSLQHPERCPP